MLKQQKSEFCDQKNIDVGQNHFDSFRQQYGRRRICDKIFFQKKCFNRKNKKVDCFCMSQIDLIIIPITLNQILQLQFLQNLLFKLLLQYNYSNQINSCQQELISSEIKELKEKSVYVNINLRLQGQQKIITHYRRVFIFIESKFVRFIRCIQINILKCQVVIELMAKMPITMNYELFFQNKLIIQVD
ncbi:unnamed protein product [Paramecium sonneborni]|uniref:Uncharacterized protein n=1 Tax=Paramecium sonneborni TaxID=65129 RepID=A0A8S1LW93_9CILI|nr:unnamed protein product [Paramecium sonneborni]